LGLLQTTPLPDSALPPGYSSATPETGTLNRAEKDHHVVGRVVFSLRGRDSLNVIVYSVWRTRDDAQWRLTHPLLGSPLRNRFRIRGLVPAFGSGSVMVEGFVEGTDSSTGKRAVLGVTSDGAVVGSVVVAGSVASTRSVSHDRTVALALLRAGIKHLKEVQR